MGQTVGSLAYGFGLALGGKGPTLLANAGIMVVLGLVCVRLLARRPKRADALGRLCLFQVKLLNRVSSRVFSGGRVTGHCLETGIIYDVSTVIVMDEDPTIAFALKFDTLPLQ